MEIKQKEIKLGKSLLVPSVQEMVKEPIAEIPPRYLQADENTPITSSDVSLPQLSVPIIDLQTLLTPGSVGDLELDRLDSACKEWGFFQLINHGVSSSLVEKVQLETQDFFRLPMIEKKKYWQTEEEVEGFGQAFVVSEEQKLDWADIFFLTTLPIHGRKPHLFPKLPLPFRDTLESYSLELKSLGMTLIKVMAKALQIETKVIEELFEDGLQSMRMNYYPPCPQPDLVIGLKPHSDSVALTILLQLNEVEGLQVIKDGKWVPIKPLSNAFIVNIGDMLEILTNGIYRSVHHRAIVNSTKERLSIATFLNPNLEGEISPIGSLITPSTPALFKTVGVKQYLQDLFTRELDGKSYLDCMKIDGNTT